MRGKSECRMPNAECRIGRKRSGATGRQPEGKALVNSFKPRNTRITRNLALLFVYLVCFVVPSVFGANKLEADLIQPGLRARSEAPIPVEVRFQWDGTRILEGRLDIELHEGNRVLGHYRSSEVALTTGEQRFHLLLPACAAPIGDSQVEARMKFITTAGDVLELDPSSLFMPTASQRSLVLAWCNARTATAAPDFEQTMLLEHFAPASNEAGRRLSLTTLVRLAPEDLPPQPLSYTAFDMVVLGADAVSETTEGQLRALARWVKGGGSVCVFANGGLQSHHLWLLNELAESVSDAPTFLADSNGYLLSGEKKIWRLRSGLGRTVIVTGNTPATDSPEWREAVAFLWKFRETRAEAIAETAHWETGTNDSGDVAPVTMDEYASQFQASQRTGAMRPRPLMTLEAIDAALSLTDAEKPKVKAALDDWKARLQAVRQNLNSMTPTERRSSFQAANKTFDAKMKGILTPDQYKKFQANSPWNRLVARPLPPFNNGMYSINPSYEVQHSMLASELMAPLLPKTVRLIPFPALLGMLGLFLLAIGPGDYFMLGWLRRRRYTWILFPALSFGFTLATVLMARHFLGARDERRSLIIVDLYKDGTPLRWNRYDLIFAAADKQAVTELKDALWVPLSSGPVPGMPYPGGVAAPRYTLTGNPRRGYVYSINNNGYAFGTYGARSYAESETGPALYDGTVPTHFQTSELIHQWQPRLNRAFSFESPPVPLLPNWRDVEAAWPDLPTVRARLSERKRFVGDVCAMVSESNPSYRNAEAFDPSTGEPLRCRVLFDPDSKRVLAASILSSLCDQESAGLLAIVSQISPNGGESSEDVPAIDGEAGDSALVIVTQSGDNIIVYRRFFHGS